MKTSPNRTQAIVSSACALITASRVTAEDPLIHVVARITAKLALDAVARQYPHLSHREHVAIATRHLQMATPETPRRMARATPTPHVFRSRN